MKDKNDLSIIEQRFSKVRKANELILKTNFSLNEQQQKIVLFLISKITPYDEKFEWYTFDIKEYCKVAGIDYDNGGNYEAVKKSIQMLTDKSMWIRKQNENGTETLIRWIDKPQINQNRGQIYIRFDEDLRPYLLQLKKNYAEWDIINSLILDSRYSVRIYEIFKAIHYDKLNPYTQTYQLEDFKKMIDATAETYNTFKKFNEKVLKPSINEINNKTDMHISYDKVKQGRFVTALTFTVELRPFADRVKQQAENNKTLGENV